MTGRSSPPDFGHVLGRLKDFQRATVAHAFHRLYEAPDASHRFLVADEVGLGKTVVASGVIAKAIERLWDSVDRIDIIYVCSNGDIARQNVNKLNVMGQTGFSSATRLTLLPLELSGLRGNKVNFVSFTPGTSFDMQGGTGRARERALIYAMLKEAWGLGNRKAPINVLSAYSQVARFRSVVDSLADHRRYPNGIDDGLLDAFVSAIAAGTASAANEKRSSLRERFERLCDVYARYDRRASREEDRERNALIGELRHLLANTCIRQLEPDLVILDEFQRFKDLLSGEGEAAELAQELFTYSNETSKARVLMLSATPYKMYTMRDETADEDHYADFVRTLRFLFNDDATTDAVAAKLQALRRAVYRGPEARPEVLALRREIEAALRRVMARTERLAVSSDRNGMLREVPAAASLRTDEAETYCAFQRIGRALDQPDIVEFWKSAPFLLNFMDSYRLKERFVDSLQLGESPEAPGVFRSAIRAGVPISLSHEAVESQVALEYPHARTRWLIEDVVERGAWKLLWIPPSLPYYELRGAFADPRLSAFTKRLVFSAWRVAPKAVATLISYEAERRMLAGARKAGETRRQQFERTNALLRFSRTRDQRLTGLPVLALVYPSIALARLGDPLNAAIRRAGPRQSAESTLTRVQDLITVALRDVLAEAKSSSATDERWYWAAPILLDLRTYPEVARRWFRRSTLVSQWLGSEDKDDVEEAVGWRSHVERVLELMNMGKSHDLGTPPTDLARVLAEIAIGGPAVCALRALSRSKNAATCLEDDQVRDAAASVAHGFRGLFNLPEVISLLRGMNPDEPYWRRTLEYGVDGCLQAVLDEYVHALQGLEGVTERTVSEAASEIAVRMRQALGMRTSLLGVDSFTVAGNGRIVRAAGRMRARFAMQFGDEASEDDKVANRKETVRSAFNSPFWPFVLASTSVGQEGLDFHLYCHAVVHWNIPPNPVDMEQREGRVHRFKGHAVRKNVAAKHGRDMESDAAEDPWSALFEIAHAWREDNTSDLVPYWVMKGDAMIERHVPNLPLSRDAARYAALRRSLAVYRMVFGQPRQEDLLEYVMTRTDGGVISADDLCIDLTPPSGE